MLEICKRCKRWQDFYQEYNRNCMMGRGSESADIMIVGEAPGRKEAAQGKLYVGDTGEELKAMIELSSYKEEDLYLTNAVKCWAFKNKTPSKSEIKQCRPHLLNEINKVKPKLIIAMGKTAMNSFGIKLQVEIASGNIHKSPYTTIPVYVMYHPANILAYPNLKEKIYKQFALGLQSVGKKVANGVKHDVSNSKGYKVIKSLKDADRAVAFLKTRKLLSVDIEATGLDYYAHDNPAELTCVGFGYAIGRSIVFPTTDDVFNEKELVYIKQCIKKVTESNVAKVVHGGKYDCGLLLYRNNINVNNIVLDTLLATHQLNENTANDLHSCVASELPDLVGYDDVIKYKYKGHPEKARGDDLWYYNGGDCDATLRLAKLYIPRLKKLDMMWLHTNILLPTTKNFIWMESYGVKFDFQVMEVLEKEYNKILLEIKKAIYKLKVVKKFELDHRVVYNPRSPLHTKELMFEYYKMPVLRKSDKTDVPSLGAAELEVYAEKYNNALAVKLLEIRKYEKAISTYLTGMYKQLYKGVAHTSFNLHITRTGRTSSGGAGNAKIINKAEYRFTEFDIAKRRSPNLQNIPNKNKELRNIVCAREGCYLISADFSQAELGCAAVLSKDDALIDTYMNTEVDSHTAIASLAFGIPYDEVTSELRRTAKAITFGILFGRSPASIARETKRSESEAESLITSYYERFFKLQQYMEFLEGQVASQGFVETPLHRRRRFPVVKADSLRQARNMPIQGFANELLLLGYCFYCDLIRRYKLMKQIVPVMLIHDEIVTETSEKAVLKTVKLLKQALLVDIYKVPRIVEVTGRLKLRMNIKISKLGGGLGAMESLNEADFSI